MPTAHFGQLGLVAELPRPGHESTAVLNRHRPVVTAMDHELGNADGQTLERGGCSVSLASIQR